MQIIKVNNINYFLNEVVYYKSMPDKVDLGIITQTGIMAIGKALSIRRHKPLCIV
jgi:hypothetical protein